MTIDSIQNLCTLAATIACVLYTQGLLMMWYSITVVVQGILWLQLCATRKPQQKTSGWYWNPT